MTFGELIESFTYTDISYLVLDYYPETDKYLEIYLKAFGQLTCLMPRFDGKVIRISEIEDDPNYVFVFDKFDRPTFNISFESWLGSEIHYHTMEHHSDSEIFIRCLHSAVLHRILAEERADEFKKKDKP